MHIHQIEFTLSTSLSSESISALINGYLAALRMNGQICGREWTVTSGVNKCIAQVNAPEQCSIDDRFASQFVKKAREAAETKGMMISSTTLGNSIDEARTCECKEPSAYALFTTYLSLESPIRCLDCFGPTPLYRFSPLASGEFYEVISWQSDYQSCDSLQMNCSVLERSATRQLSDLSSSLSKAGIAICKALSLSCGKPVYYYLYRANGRSAKSEKNRCCPSCGSKWQLDRPQHELFDFRCNKCLLLSNIAWNVKC